MSSKVNFNLKKLNKSLILKLKLTFEIDIEVDIEI